MKRAIFLILLLPLPVLGHGEPHEGEAMVASDAAILPGWHIEDDQICTGGTLVVQDNVTILPGGSLTLDGCRLVFDTPAYNDTYFAHEDEGLTLTVHPGASLRLRSTSSAAGIAPADARYGYTMKVYGLLEVEGTPERPATIQGMEGAYQGRLATGGLQIRGGHAAILHAEMAENWGPALFVIRNGTAVVSHTTITSGGGIIAARAAAVAIDNSTISVPVGAVSLSHVPRVAIHDSVLEAETVAVYAAASALDIKRSHIVANHTGLQLVSTAATLRDVAVTYGVNGVNAGAQSRFTKLGLEASIVIRDATFAGDADSDVAIAALAVAVDVQGSHFSGHGGNAINASSAPRVVIAGNHFEAGTSHAIHLLNPGPGFILDSNRYAGPGVRIDRLYYVAVFDEDHPGPGLRVKLGAAEATTNEAGVATLGLTWWDGLDRSFDGEETLPLSVTRPGEAAAFHDAIPAHQPVTEVRLEAGPTPWLRFLGLAAAGAAVAVFLVIRATKR